MVRVKKSEKSLTWYGDLSIRQSLVSSNLTRLYGDGEMGNAVQVIRFAV